MKLLKLCYIGLVSCLVVCLFLETATPPPSALLTFEVKEKERLKSGGVRIFAIRMNAPDFERRNTQGLHRSRTSKLKNRLSKFFERSIPLAAMFAVFVSIALMVILCCVTFLIDEPVY